MRSQVLAVITVGVLSGTFSVSAPGASISYSDSYGYHVTDWGLPLTPPPPPVTLSIPQFNPTLGTLNSISFQLTGKLTGDIAFESTDGQPQTIGYMLSATITLYRPDNSPIVVASPVYSGSDYLTAFDGIYDYAGTSGRHYFYTDPPNAIINAGTYTSPPPVSDLTLFTGMGNIALPVSAVALSEITASGNFGGSVDTLARADVTVTYDYSTGGNPVPEPTSLVLWLGMVGCCGCAAIWRRRKKILISAS